MAKNVPIGLIMINRQGEIIVLNPQARILLDFGIDDKVTSNVLEEKIKALGLDESFEESQSKGKSVTKEIAISQRGQNVVLRSDITPVKDTKGVIIGILTILRDVTGEKEINKIKTEFISTVSHELRTPLSTMKEFVSIILKEIPGKLTHDQKEYMGIIKGNIDRLARLVNDLLDFSKIEAGKIELKRMFVDITKIAKDVIFNLKIEADKKYIEVKVLFQESLPRVYADPDKMIQVFTNLIENAIKFTPDKGKITVKIVDKEKEIECSITDTGRGIGPDDMNKLFTKFQQFDRTAGAGAKGNGLGLTITKELIKRHNGRIWAESKLSKGTKFIFTLPKHTTQSLFKEYADNGIKETIKKNSKMSLIAMSIANFEKLNKKLSNKEIQSVLQDIENTIKNNLHRTGDSTIKGAGEIMVILADCDKKSALLVESRLKQAVDDYLALNKLIKKIELCFECATYPDEAKNGEELIKRAMKTRPAAHSLQGDR